MEGQCRARVVCRPYSVDLEGVEEEEEEEEKKSNEEDGGLPEWKDSRLSARRGCKEYPAILPSVAAAHIVVSPPFRGRCNGISFFLFYYFSYGRKNKKN